MRDHDPDLDPTLPHRLADDLRRLHSRSAPVPRATDEAILHDARAGVARRRRFRAMLRWSGAGAAAAAAIVVLVTTVRFRNTHSQPPHVASNPAAIHPAPAGDANGDGRVDILDAYLVAKRVERRDAAPPPEWDLNRDGRVDRADVEQIAAAAVRLPQQEGTIQ